MPRTPGGRTGFTGHPRPAPTTGPHRSPLRRTLTILALTTALLALPAATGTAAADGRATATGPARAAATPLPPALERVRAAEATALYGGPAERPPAERRTSLVSLGDSEISGEGVGRYEPGTDGPHNWCHRSPDAAVHRTGIPADTTYNIACSGAATANIRIGGTRQYADEPVQSDNLAIKARNTRVKLVLLVAGANDDLRFGPVITDCVLRWWTLQGACAPKYGPGWQTRVGGLVPKVTATVADLRTVMRDAGYAGTDYRLVVMGYPGPLGPDIRDNPRFPGKIPGGCTGYDADAVWARDAAVPAFQAGMRQAARAAGATYLDASRLFHGHEVCMDDAWARGLYIDASTFPPGENSVRQSFHPNARGHAAFASCLTQLYASGSREAGCADVAGAEGPRLYEGAWDDRFRPLRGEATGTCADAEGGASANGTRVIGWDCAGSRDQGWWYDPGPATLHSELSHDRCADVPGGAYTAGTAVTLYDCHGGANQRFVRDAGTLRPASATGLCLTLAAPRDAVRLQPCDGSARQRFV